MYELIPELLRGTWITLQVAAGGTLVAIVTAVIAAICRLYGPRPLRWLAVAYIETFRGTSALVQLFWLFFVLPHFGITLSSLTVGIIGLGLNVGAYGAEVVRGAINAVPSSQWEAATALNLGRLQALRRIILPQALVAMIPPWGNLLIELLKATSLVSLITLSDLAFKAQQLNQNTLRTTEIFGMVLLIYLAISLTITAGMRALERRAARGLRRGRVA
ncbi:MAG: ectoine/hydroxyectoine ABC transporter permease subunit EhuC [Burkholderiaceae bacterium]